MLLSLVKPSSLIKLYCFCATCGKKIRYSHTSSSSPTPPTNLMCRSCESKLIHVTIDGVNYELPSDIDDFHLFALFGKDPARWKVTEKFQFTEISRIEKISDRVTQDAQCDVCQVFLPTTESAFYCEDDEKDLCSECIKTHHNGHSMYRFENLSCGFTDLWFEGEKSTNKMPPSIYSDLNRIVSGLFTIRARNADQIQIWMGENSLQVNPDSIDSLHDNEKETCESIIRLLKRLNQKWFGVSLRLNMLIRHLELHGNVNRPLLPCSVHTESIERRLEMSPVERYRMELLNDRKRSREMKEKQERVEYAIPGEFTNGPVWAFEREMKRGK
jgi:hypothetical protein